MRSNATNAAVSARTVPKPDADAPQKKKRKTQGNNPRKPKVTTTVNELATTIQNKYFAKPQGEGAQKAGEMGKATSLKRWFE